MTHKDKRFIVAAGILAMALPGIVRVVAAQPRNYFMPSGSMEPTIPLASRIRVQRAPFQSIARVRRGDIIVLNRLDKGSGTTIEAVKRVVGLPGDRVQLSGTSIWLNGRKLPHTLLRRAGKVSVWGETVGKTTYRVQYGDNVAPSPAFSGTVPANTLFCLGDNRDNSNDSRYTGAVPFATIIGKKVL